MRARRSALRSSVESIQPPERYAQAVECSLAALAKCSAAHGGGLVQECREQRFSIGFRQLAHHCQRGLRQISADELLLGAIVRGLSASVFLCLAPPEPLALERSAFPRRDRECPRHGGALRIVVGRAFE